MIPDVSPPRSFKGFSWKAWLARNKGRLKTVVSVIAGVVTERLAAIPDPVIRVAVASLVSVGTAAILDWIDFYFSEVEIP